MYQYILFDLDGTLTDSREGIFNSIRYSLEKLGRPCPPYETLLRFVGPPLQDSFAEFCSMTKEEAWEAVQIFRERYEVLGWAENRAADGVEELMGRLKEKGYIMAIATSKPERSAIPIAEKFGFTQHLAAVCGSDGKNESKADVIRDAFARLGIGEEEKARCVMIGDRKFDVEGAAQCGIPCIGVEFFDFAPPGELEQAGALCVCKTVEELEAYLLKEMN